MRRKNESVLVELFGLVAAMPPWVGIVLAITSYFIFHWLAGSQPQSHGGPAQAAALLGNAILRGLAWGCQVLFPVLFVLASVVSTFQRVMRARVATEMASNSKPPPQSETAPSSEPDFYPIWRDVTWGRVPTPTIEIGTWTLDLLRALEWKRFEEVCAAYFETLGFRTRTTHAGADGGIDIHLMPEGSDHVAIVVQCKAWKVYKVGVKPIRELLGVMTAARVSEGAFVTTGEYTIEATDLAKVSNIVLIDGANMVAKLKALDPEKQDALLRLATAGDFTTPTCPSCGVKMVRREPRAGGEAFWGCVNYPRCRTTLKMPRDATK